jgi:hypothetical protein
VGCGCAKPKKLNVPYYPDEGDTGHFDIQTLLEKLVSEYTGFNLREVDELNYFVFCLYLRDAAIYRYMQTEEGQEYLEKCWTIRQTEPDRGALRVQFGNKEASRGREDEHRKN